METYVLYRRGEERKTGQEKEPSITVSPTKVQDKCYLEVSNSGGSGEFEAQITVLEGANHLQNGPNHYVARWKNEKGKYAKILGGHIGLIRIGQIFPTGMILFYWQSKEDDSHMSSYEFAPAKPPDAIPPQERTSHRDISTRFNLVDSTPEFLLEVTINALEGLKKGSIVKQYRLTPSKWRK